MKELEDAKDALFALSDDAELIREAETEEEAFENWPCGCELKPHDDDCGYCRWDSICNG